MANNYVRVPHIGTEAFFNHRSEDSNRHLHFNSRASCRLINTSQTMVMYLAVTTIVQLYPSLLTNARLLYIIDSTAAIPTAWQMGTKGEMFLLNKGM